MRRELLREKVATACVSCEKNRGGEENGSAYRITKQQEGREYLEEHILAHTSALTCLNTQMRVSTFCLRRWGWGKRGVLLLCMCVHVFDRR